MGTKSSGKTSVLDVLTSNTHKNSFKKQQMATYAFNICISSTAASRQITKHKHPLVLLKLERLAIYVASSSLCVLFVLCRFHSILLYFTFRSQMFLMCVAFSINTCQRILKINKMIETIKNK